MDDCVVAPDPNSVGTLLVLSDAEGVLVERASSLCIVATVPYLSAPVALNSPIEPREMIPYASVSGDRSHRVALWA